MAAPTVRGSALTVVTAMVALTTAVIGGPLARPAAAAPAAVPGRTVTSLQPGPGSTGQAVVVMPDGRRIVAGSAGGDFGLFHFSDVSPDGGFGADRLVTTDFGGRTDVVRALARGASYSLVAAGSSNGDVAVARYDLYGDLDPDFGDAGKVLTDLGGADDAAYGVVVQPSGKVVVAGGNSSTTVVTRYNADGTPDTGFAGNGRVTLPWGRPARALLAQPDGALVVVGSGGTSIDVARLTIDGALDPTFGTDGAVRVATGAGTAANAGVILGDGRIVVAGGRDGDVLLARLQPTGALDASFGAQGIAAPDFGRNETANGVAMGPDGRLRVVGEATDGTGFTSVHLPAGALDSAPGSLRVTPVLKGIVFQFDVLVTAGIQDGLVYSDRAVPFPPGSASDRSAVVEQATASALQPDGKLIVAGATSGVIGLLRFTTGGVLDPSFGIGGKVVSDLAWNPSSVVVQPGGRIVVAGIHRDSLALVGFRPDGSVDPTFGTAGRVLTDAGAEWHPVLSLLSGGRLLAGGADGQNGFLARYSAAGVPDPTFGDGGLVRGAFPAPAGSMKVAKQPDGKTLVTGVDNSLSRFNPDGSADVTFGVNGTRRMGASEVAVNRDFAAIAVEPDGRILVGGVTGSSQFAVVRLQPDGARDATWPLSPIPIGAEHGAHELAEVILQPDGRVLSVGDRVAARYHSDGTPDATFGTGGRFELQYPSDAVVSAFVAPDGLLWSVGTDGSSPLLHGFVLTMNRLSEGGKFHALAPARILDTRVGNGAPAGKLGPNSSLFLQVAGRGGVPATGVSAVVMNLTITEPTEGTFLTAWPGDTERPVASNLNVSAGQTLPNLVTVALGSQGGIVLYNNHGSAHLVADVSGWYGSGFDATGARYHPVTPSRLLDTRDGAGVPVGPGGILDLQVTGRGGVPATGVSAVAMSVTAVGPTAGTFVTAWPAGQARPLASNLNVVAGQTAPNLVVVAAGAGGKVSLYNLAGSVHLIADVAGWFGDGTEPGGARFHPFAPSRILDTRDGNGAPVGPIGPLLPLELQVTGRGGVPAVDVTSVILNVTVTEPTASAHLTVWPSGQPRPLASNLNFGPGLTVANLVTVGVGAGGKVSIYNAAGSSHVVVDVAGWYGG